MTANGEPPPTAPVVRRLEDGDAAALVGLVETFEELQTVLRCCEHLVAAVAEPEPDAVVVEAVWTLALASYARCFHAPGGDALTEDDVASTQPGQPAAEVLEWHRLLLRLRDHHTDPAVNPRERFSAGVTQDADGRASGVAITSARQPLVDDVTVRQTGAVAYALSALVDSRLEVRQAELLDTLRAWPTDELNRLVPVDVTGPAPAS